MIVGGIDGGLDGGLVFLFEGVPLVMEIMPTVALTRGKGNRRDFDELALVEVLEKYKPAHIYYELAQPRPQQGTVSTFTTGQGVGVLRGVLAALRIPSTKVYSQRWQRVMFAGITYEKGNPAAVKAAAMTAARRLWPDQDWRKSTRAREPHKGLVDAALMAEYGRRELEGLNAIQTVDAGGKRRG